MISAEGTPSPSILSASRVSKSFGEIPVLFSVDFDIRPGEVHAPHLDAESRLTGAKKVPKSRQPTASTISIETSLS